jgi:hypothetical protein
MLCGATRIGGFEAIWHLHPMHTALIFALGLGTVFVGIAAIVTVMAALRRAPEGVENDEGFAITGAVQPAVVKNHGQDEYMGAMGHAA